MDDGVVMFPETRVRYDVLAAALAHIGTNFEPGQTDAGHAHEAAVRAALGLGEGPLRADTIDARPSKLMHQVFGEIVQTAIAYERNDGPETNENVLAAKAYGLTPAGVTWMENRDHALDVAFGVIVFWLSSIQGGLIEATADLTVGGVDWHDLLL